jgi:hypothetical protein
MMLVNCLKKSNEKMNLEFILDKLAAIACYETTGSDSVSDVLDAYNELASLDTLPMRVMKLRRGRCGHAKEHNAINGSEFCDECDDVMFENNCNQWLPKYYNSFER